jgi:hypothetical protein
MKSANYKAPLYAVFNQLPVISFLLVSNVLLYTLFSPSIYVLPSRLQRKQLSVNYRSDYF